MRRRAGHRGAPPLRRAGRVASGARGESRPARGASRVPDYNPGVTSSYVSGGEYLMPMRIHADRAAGTLEIDWADGHRTGYTAVELRWLCPCAYCRGEAGQPGWLDGSPTLTPEQTRLVDVQLVGTYAIAPTWADGHHTGYYTFAQLRASCPCPEDRARRAAGGFGGEKTRTGGTGT